MSQAAPPQLNSDVQKRELESGAYRETELGIFPKDWDVVLLESVAKRGSGHTPDKKHPEYWNGKIKWVSLADSDQLDNVYINQTFANITPLGLANSSAVLHPPGTVILSRDAGVGKSAIMADEMSVSQHFIAWQCGPRLHNQFFYYWLQLNKAEFERIAIGNTIKTIGLPFFKNLKIPVPPFSEQSAIVAALSNVDALTSALHTLVLKKRAVKLGIMQQLLTGSVRLPGFDRKWDTKCIGEFTDCTAGGTPKTSVAAYWGGDNRWMSSGELNLKLVTEVQGRITDEGLRNSSARMLPAHCVLIGLAGQGKTRGTVALNKVPLSTNQSIAAVYPNTNFCPEYLYYNLDLRYEELRGMSAGEGGRGGLNLTIIRSIPVPLPELKEQCAIASTISDSDTEIAALECQLNKTKAVKQGMMQALLTGRIRLNKPEVSA